MSELTEVVERSFSLRISPSGRQGTIEKQLSLFGNKPVTLLKGQFRAVTTTSAIKSLLSLLICISSITTCVLAGPPREGSSGNEGWEATVTNGNDQYLSVYCFLPDGVLVETQKYPGKNGTISFGFYEQKDGELVIKWNRLRNASLVHVATEMGKLNKVSDGSLSYTITGHTEPAQVGQQLEFKRIAFNDQEYEMMLDLARGLHQLKLKELNEQRLVDVYKNQIKQYEEDIQRLLK